MCHKSSGTISNKIRLQRHDAIKLYVGAELDLQPQTIVPSILEGGFGRLTHEKMAVEDIGKKVWDGPRSESGNNGMSSLDSILLCKLWELR
jgi:hypothetical protein